MTDLADDDVRASWKASLGSRFRGRRTLMGIAPLAALTPWVSLVRRYGGDPPLVLVNSRGTGPVPADDDAVVVGLDTPVASRMTDEVRRLDHLLRDGLPEDVRAAVERYDPAREGTWLVPEFVEARPVLGRPVLGGRPTAWSRLEDKTTVDALWDALGVERPPSLVVPVDRAALEDAHAAVATDPATGTVWAGDARDGINGAGDYVRWVVTDAEREAATDFFAGRCDRVRVAPFLDGVPCSIHGCVLADAVAVFRPMELGNLRRADRTFLYGGLGTAWDPPPADREQMRDTARRTGERLAADVDYRGFFGIDGVLTADGFRPTELNPRFSAGAGALGSHLDPEAFLLLHFALAAGDDPLLCAADLERWVVDASDARRFLRAAAVGRAAGPVEAVERRVGWDGRRLTWTEDPEGWPVRIGPTTVGLRVHLDVPEPTPGQRVGPVNAALLRLLDDELGTSFGDVRPAPDLRTSASPTGGGR